MAEYCPRTWYKSCLLLRYNILSFFFGPPFRLDAVLGEGPPQLPGCVATYPSPTFLTPKTGEREKEKGEKFVGETVNVGFCFSPPPPRKARRSLACPRCIPQPSPKEGQGVSCGHHQIPVALCSSIFSPGLFPVFPGLFLSSNFPLVAPPSIPPDKLVYRACVCSNFTYGDISKDGPAAVA